MSTRAASPVAALRGDVHHEVNPVIGWMRRHFHAQTGGVDPLTVPTGSDRLPDTTGLPEQITIDTGMFVSMVRRLAAATAAADRHAEATDRDGGVVPVAEITRILDAYNTADDGETPECAPEDRWRLYRDLHALTGHADR